MIMSRHGAAGACGGPASLLALLRRREALARTPRLGRRRRALRPRRALRRALRRRRRRRLRRGLRRRLRLGSGRSLLALRLRELLADDDDHLRTNGGAGARRARWDRGSARARWDRGSARSRAAAADGERCARAFAFVSRSRARCAFVRLVAQRGVLRGGRARRAVLEHAGAPRSGQQPEPAASRTTRSYQAAVHKGSGHVRRVKRQLRARTHRWGHARAHRGLLRSRHLEEPHDGVVGSVGELTSHFCEGYRGRTVWRGLPRQCRYTISMPRDL